MKKIFLIAMIFSTISLGAFAQNGKGDKRKGGDRHNAMKELNLTQDQQTKIKSLNEDYKTKMKDLKAQQKSLSESHRNSVKQVLTSEQQAQLKDIRKEKGKDFKKKNKDFAKNKSHKKGKDLNLDQATKSKLVTLKENFQKEKQAVQMSRIAPEEQTRRIKELRLKYRTERKQIIQDFRTTTRTVKQNS